MSSRINETRRTIKHISHLHNISKIEHNPSNNSIDLNISNQYATVLRQENEAKKFITQDYKDNNFTGQNFDSLQDTTKETLDKTTQQESEL